jgi:uncharacterized protein (TIGR00251 family)
MRSRATRKTGDESTSPNSLDKKNLKKVKLQIKVLPSSSQDCVAGWLKDTLKVKVKAPPEKGKANKAIIKVLEKTFGIPKGSMKISSGKTSSRKTIEITCDEAVINKKLEHIGNN